MNNVQRGYEDWPNWNFSNMFFLYSMNANSLAILFSVQIICSSSDGRWSRPLGILPSEKLIIDTRTKFCIYARRAFRLQKTHQWRSNPTKLKRPNKVRSWRALRTKIDVCKIIKNVGYFYHWKGFTSKAKFKETLVSFLFERDDICKD